MEPLKQPINYLAQTSSYSQPSYTPPPQQYTNSYISPFSPMQQVAFYTASQPQQQPQQPQYMNHVNPTNQQPVVLETSNLGNVTVEVAQQHIALVSAMVSSYTV